MNNYKISLIRFVSLLFKKVSCQAQREILYHIGAYNLIIVFITLS